MKIIKLKVSIALFGLIIGNGLLTSCETTEVEDEGRVAEEGLRKPGLYKTLHDDDEVSDPEDEGDDHPSRTVRVEKKTTITTPGDEVSGPGDLTGPGDAAPPPLPPSNVAQYGILDPAHKGYIRSPYMRDKLIDARGIISGTEFDCPYTGKKIKMP